jgi:polyphosphate kinase 2 (PPK2 family)
MSLTLSKPDYKARLKKYQGKLNLFHRRAMAKGISTIVVCEGPDAAGKGGMIRRLIAAIDPHNYQVLPFAAPTDEERARHYLWRFWRHLSRAGDFTVFDRSWYGRVLVERVEGFASEAEWRRAYAEINDFEEQLIEHGIVLVKLWIHITKEEQLHRFKERENTPHKSWKLTEEDWRNREKWDDYEQAAHDMFQYTSTRYSPWVLVEGNSKYYARVKAVKTMCDYLEQALKRKTDLTKNPST